MAKYHTQRDEEQDDAAGDRQRYFGQLQPFQEQAAAQHEREQHDIGNEAFAQHDARASGSRHIGKRGNDNRDIAERIDDEQ